MRGGEDRDGRGGGGWGGGGVHSRRGSGWPIEIIKGRKNVNNIVGEPEKMQPASVHIVLLNDTPKDPCFFSIIALILSSSHFFFFFSPLVDKNKIKKTPPFSFFSISTRFPRKKLVSLLSPKYVSSLTPTSNEKVSRWERFCPV